MVLEESVPKDVSFIVMRSPPKWLNIVLDINGILYHCMEKAAMNRMSFVNDVKQRIHLSMVFTIVGPKAIFTHPGLLLFLNAITKFVAHVFIWSSMKKSTVEDIVNYYFRSLPLLFEIRRQDSCRKIEIS